MGAGHGGRVRHLSCQGRAQARTSGTGAACPPAAPRFPGRPRACRAKPAARQTTPPGAKKRLARVDFVRAFVYTERYETPRRAGLIAPAQRQPSPLLGGGPPRRAKYKSNDNRG